ncbi:TPA: hypothetical protein MH439_25015 [Klebsiella pneumoniae]|nr:hypothetical protein C4Z29_004410 [Klebsiella quasipneumoniae subsp. quasipneumoniae]HBX5405958.1 hypothetical protein [Klebsiella pneumoniae]
MLAGITYEGYDLLPVGQHRLLLVISAVGTKQTLKTTASDAALAAWRRQMKLHVSVESNGAESPA